MDPLDGVVVKCFPSATIAKLSRLLSNDVKLHNFEYIIIHVGTNNIGTLCHWTFIPRLLPR